MRKKYYGIVLAAVLAMSLSACGTEGKEGETEIPGTEQTAREEEKKKSQRLRAGRAGKSLCRRKRKRRRI